MPASIQAWTCLHASRRTQWPIGEIRPQSSAMGMNFAGGMSPRSGWRQRISASTPTISSGLEIDFRLVVQHELPSFEGAAQAAFEEMPLDGTDVHVLGEELVIVPPLVLCVIHRGVRALDQGLRIRAVVGVDADADARGDMELPARRYCAVPPARARIFSALRAASSARSISESSTTNSSPPWRLTVSEPVHKPPGVAQPTAAVCRQSHVPGSR